MSVPPSSQSANEEEDTLAETTQGIFASLQFYLDSDVNQEVRHIIQKENGTIVGPRPTTANESHNRDKNFKWIINQAYLTQEEDPLSSRGCQVVLQNWVNMCALHRGIVEVEPFVVSEPFDKNNARRRQQLEDLAKAAAEKRIKPDPYTKREDELLLTFANENGGELKTQEALWKRAEAKGLIPKRTAISMMKRYAQLKRNANVLDKKGLHFNEIQDLSLLKWAYCWHFMDRVDKENDLKIWEAAQQNDVVYSRKASQLEARYRRVLKQHGGFAKSMKLFPNGVDDEMWLTFFKPKTNHNEDTPL